MAKTAMCQSSGMHGRHWSLGGRRTLPLNLFSVRKNGQRVRDFRRAWQNATEKAGLAGRKFHGPRRGMATRVMATGADSQTARKITGDKDAATFEQYRQIRSDAILQAGRKLEKAQRANRDSESVSSKRATRS
jgi:integrase